MDIKKNVSLSEQIAQQIIDYITSHKMMPGDKLPTEAEFLERWDIGRSTLREAFKLLIARNILETRQGSGTFVSPKRGIPDDPLGLTFIYDENQLALDMVEVRLILEPEAAALAAAYASRTQKVAIREAASEIESAIRANKSYTEADSRLHKLIAEATGNQIIGNLNYILNSSIAKNIEVVMNKEREQNIIHYHRLITRAIEEGNILNAKHFMTMHLTNIKEFILLKM